MSTLHGAFASLVPVGAAIQLPRISHKPGCGAHFRTIVFKIAATIAVKQLYWDCRHYGLNSPIGSPNGKKPAIYTTNRAPRLAESRLRHRVEPNHGANTFCA